LQTLGKTTLAVALTGFPMDKHADSLTYTTTITNTGKTVAFQVHIRARKGRDGDDILPVIFSDNYLLLAPGESRTIHCTYAAKDAEGAVPTFEYEGWNTTVTGSSR